MVKLSEDTEYKRPIETYTDKLTKDEIAQKLEDYKKVPHDEINNIKLGEHMRYFVKNDDGTYSFRMGGVLRNKTGLPNYIILGSGSKTWSVQVKNSILYVKMSIKEIKDEYRESLIQKDKKINELLFQNTECIRENEKLKKEIAKIKKMCR